MDQPTHHHTPDLWTPDSLFLPFSVEFFFLDLNPSYTEPDMENEQHGEDETFWAPGTVALEDSEQIRLIRVVLNSTQ